MAGFAVGLMLSLLVALSPNSFAAPCAGPLDCNGRECEDCKCVNSVCACADGWTGTTCSVPFCVNRTSGCSSHGDCEQSAKAISCACDAGWSGPRCETAVCPLKCLHGGTPDAKCTTCVGCRGAWSGKLCDAWNATFSNATVAAQLVTLKTASLKSLQTSLKYHPICKQAQECVGWGVDLGTGKVSQYPQIDLDFSGDTPSWNGLKYPEGISLSPSQAPAFVFDTHVFPTIADFHTYVSGLRAQQEGRIGTYADALASVEAVFDSLSDWFPSITQATYELYNMALDPGATHTMDPAALAALETLAPTYAQDPTNWDTFFSNWGTSVVSKSHSGGLLEFMSYASTSLVGFGAADPFSSAQLQAEAQLVFTNGTRLGGHTGAVDPRYRAHSFPGSHAYRVHGGEATAAPLGRSDLSAWFTSLRAAPVLTSFELLPLSAFVADTELAAALDAATAAYIAKTTAPWARNISHCPPSCHAHGACAAGHGHAACTCDDDHVGRQCSVFAPAPTRVAALSCALPDPNLCAAVTSAVGLGGDFRSDYPGSKGLKCHCSRDASGSLRAQQRRDPAQSVLVCSGEPLYDWDFASVSSCGGCQCRYVRQSEASTSAAAASVESASSPAEIAATDISTTAEPTAAAAAASAPSPPMLRLPALHSTASEAGAVWGRGFDAGSGLAVAPVIVDTFADSGATNYGQWLHPETGVTYQVPDSAAIASTPSSSSQDIRTTFNNMSEYLSWTGHYDMSHLILIFYNSFHAEMDVYAQWLLSDRNRAVVASRRQGTSFKADLWDASVLKQAMRPGGNQSGSHFAKAVRLLPADRGTPANRALYDDFLMRFGTHLPSSLFGGYSLTLFASALTTDVAKIGASFEAQVSASMIFFLIGLNLAAKAGADVHFNFTNDFKESITFGANALGGSPAALADGNFSHWVDTVDAHPVPISVELRNISDFVDDDAKAALVLEAATEYLAASKALANASGIPSGVAADGSICSAPAGTNLTFDQLPQAASRDTDTSPPAPMDMTAGDAPPPQLPALDLTTLGFGWDIKQGTRLGGTLAPATFVKGIVWPDPYQQNKHFLLSDGLTLTAHPEACLRVKFELIDNASAYVDAGFRAGFDFFSIGLFGLKFSYMFEKFAAYFDAGFTNEALFMVSAGFHIGLFSLDHAATDAALSSTFTSAVAALPSSAGATADEAAAADGEFDAFVTRWGTHYVSSELFGGGCNFTLVLDAKIKATMSASMIQESSAFHIKIKILGPLGLPIWMWKEAHKSHDASHSVQFNASIKEMKMNCVGGRPELMGTAEKPVNGSFKRWADTIAATPAPLHVGRRFRGMHDLVMLDGEATDVQLYKRQGLIAAITRALSVPPSPPPPAAVAVAAAAVAATATVATPTLVEAAVDAATAATSSSSPPKPKASSRARARTSSVASQMLPGVCNGRGATGIGCGYDATKIDAKALTIAPKKPVIQLDMCPEKCYLFPERADSDPDCASFGGFSCHWDYPFKEGLTYRMPTNVAVHLQSEADFDKEAVKSDTAQEYNQRIVHHTEHSSGFIITHHHSHTDIEFYHEFFAKNYSMYFSSAEYKYFWVSFPPLPKPKVTDEFRLATLFLPRLYDKARYRKFLDDFGTHYMDSAWMGATAIMSTYYHSCFRDIWSGKEVYDMSSSSFLGLWGHKSGHAQGYNKTTALFRSYSQTIVKLVGGAASTHGTMSYDSNGQPVTLSVPDQQAWIDSVSQGDRMVPVQFTLQPLTDLIIDPVKRANVNRSIVEYVGDVKIEMDDLARKLTPTDPYKPPAWCKWVPH